VYLSFVKLVHYSRTGCEADVDARVDLDLQIYIRGKLVLIELHCDWPYSDGSMLVLDAERGFSDELDCGGDECEDSVKMVNARLYQSVYKLYFYIAIHWKRHIVHLVNIFKEFGSLSQQLD
jgi:hypothetical protein